tara:strand:- start:1047 stop:1520 length:474 start_codon:yes stop_codon:yes gene_type:complete
MIKLKINNALFIIAFNRDSNFHNPSDQTAYLDLKSGDIFWVYDSDHDAEMDGFSAEDNRRNQALLASRPKDFINIDGLSHDVHHDIIKDFLASSWTDDKEQHSSAMGVYYGRNSIGYWVKNVEDDEAITGYHRFKDERIHELGLEFLKQHEIEPEWF